MDIPERKISSLKIEDILPFLHQLIEQNFNVNNDTRSYFIDINDTYSIRISPINGSKLQIQLQKVGNIINFLDIDNLRVFEKTIESLIKSYSGHSISINSTTVRTKISEPASNKSKISKQLIGKKITGIFDPYLDNKGLENLYDIISLADINISDDLKVISSDIVTSGCPRLTKSFFEDWKKQINKTNSLVRLTKAHKEHRRFILLEGNQALILGCSLNDLNKNEISTIVSDADEDFLFFKETWKNSTQWPLI